MSSSTRCLPLLAGFVTLLSACGEPPQALPTSPPYMPGSAASVGSVPVLPTTPVTTVTTLPPIPTVAPPPPPAYPPYPVATPTITTVPPTRSPTPTPAHARACVGEPTGAQILTLIKSQDGVPAKPLKVDEGPFCAGIWSFTTVEIDGKNEDQLEPLMVLATGTGATLKVVAAGSDGCSNRVQTEAPPGIRVLACGF